MTVFFLLLQQCREFRTILANEDQASALRSERRIAAREWSEKLHHIQRDLDKARLLRDQAVSDLAEERRKTEKLEKALLKKGMGDILHAKVGGIVPAGKEGGRQRRRSGSLDGLSLIASESPVSRFIAKGLHEEIVTEVLNLKDDRHSRQLS